MARITREQLRSFARLGALRRLEEIRQEIAALYRTFPGLRDESRRRQAAPAEEQAEEPRQRPRARRSHFSPARLRQMSLMMKRRHAALRRAGKPTPNGGRYPGQPRRAAARKRRGWKYTAAQRRALSAAMKASHARRREVKAAQQARQRAAVEKLSQAAS